MAVVVMGDLCVLVHFALYIRLYDSNTSIVSDPMYADADEVMFLESETPLKSFSCRVENAIRQLQYQLLYVLAG